MAEALAFGAGCWGNHVRLSGQNIPQSASLLLKRVILAVLVSSMLSVPICAFVNNKLNVLLWAGVTDPLFWQRHVPLASTSSCLFCYSTRAWRWLLRVTTSAFLARRVPLAGRVLLSSVLVLPVLLFCSLFWHAGR
jgi:hypothetical protein